MSYLGGLRCGVRAVPGANCSHTTVAEEKREAFVVHRLPEFSLGSTIYKP